jgi:TolA-binding protein
LWFEEATIVSLFGKRNDEDAPPARTAYGIDHAIRLMRTIPVDQHVDLVVTVIKNTLESLNVRLGDIVEDASRKQEYLTGRIADLKGEIAQLEQEVERRNQEIRQIEADLAETTSVKERLLLADVKQLEAKPPVAAKPPPPPTSAPNQQVPPPPPPPRRASGSSD